MAALEQAWAAIGRHHAELPQAVLVTGPGSDPRRAELVRLGHFRRRPVARRHPCPRRIWVSPATFTAGLIAWGVCSQLFSPAP